MLTSKCSVEPNIVEFYVALLKSKAYIYKHECAQGRKHAHVSPALAHMFQIPLNNRCSRVWFAIILSCKAIKFYPHIIYESTYCILYHTIPQNPEYHRIESNDDDGDDIAVQ